MTTQNFAYWLQGFFEISEEEKLSAPQIKTIKNHINLVKKCWEPKKETPLAQEDFGMDLPPVEDEFNLEPACNPDGEVLLRC